MSLAGLEKFLPEIRDIERRHLFEHAATGDVERDEERWILDHDGACGKLTRTEWLIEHDARVPMMLSYGGTTVSPRSDTDSTGPR